MRKPLHKYNPNASATRTQFKRRGETRREVCSTTTTTIWTAENENESETDNTISVNQHMPRQKETMKPSWPQDFPSEKVITELVLSETFNPAGSDVSVVLFNAIREDSVLDVDDIFAASYKKHFDTMCCALDFLWEKFNHNATKKHRNRIQKIRKALSSDESGRSK
ncbi:hypothetical protein BC832DRAFT_159501 [Gaertneriomyces semiglobifer]|nr:hypothetical protein BC832DRAFT_159501 [Gaertneriomyces semiglobifer]